MSAHGQPGEAGAASESGTPAAGAGSGRSRRATLALVLGALLGVLLAGASLIDRERDDGTLGEGLIARVNGTALRWEQFERGVESLALDKRNPLTHEDRVHVLTRIIDEELLIQRGVEIGLLRSERSVRAAIASAMIDSVVADVASQQPSEASLRDFYARNLGYFSPPPRLHVQQILFRGELASQRAAEAHLALLAGEPFAELRARLGDPELAPVPSLLLPPAKLRDYLGPGLVEEAARLQERAFSTPLESPSGHHILRLVAREGPAPAAFEAVRPRVEAEYRRRTGDEALRSYLAGLRERADVILSEEAPR